MMVDHKTCPLNLVQVNVSYEPDILELPNWIQLPGCQKKFLTLLLFGYACFIVPQKSFAIQTWLYITRSWKRRKELLFMGTIQVCSSLVVETLFLERERGR